MEKEERRGFAFEATAVAFSIEIAINMNRGSQSQVRELPTLAAEIRFFSNGRALDTMGGCSCIYML